MQGLKGTKGKRMGDGSARQMEQTDFSFLCGDARPERGQGKRKEGRECKADGHRHVPDVGEVSSV